MIFKTFDSKIDKWTSKIGIFGKSFNELRTAINDTFKSTIDNLDNFDENVGFWKSLKNNLFSKRADKDWIKNSLGDIISKENIDSYIEQLDLETAKEKIVDIFNHETLVKQNKKSWQDYFDTLDDGESYIVDLIKNTDDLSKLTGEDLVKANQQARASALAHNESIKAQTFSAKAGKVALQALAMAGNMMAMWGITEVISAIYSCITASDRLQESAKDLGSQFSSTKSDIEGYKSKINDLYKTINDSSSSYEDTYNARKELLAIQDEMIEKFGNEAEAVELVTSAIHGNTEAFDDLTKQKWQETVNEFTNGSDKKWTESVGDSWANLWSGASNNFDRMIKEMENTEVSFRVIPRYDDEGTYEEFSKKLKENFGASITHTERDDIFTLSGDLDEIYDQLLNIQSLATNMGIDDSFLPDLSRQADETKKTLESYQEIYNQHILYDKILDSDTYEQSFKEINDAYKKYQEEFASGNDEAIETAKQSFAEIVQSATEGISDQSVIDYFNSMYPDLQEVVGSWEFEVKFKAAIDDNADNFENEVKDAIGKFENSNSILNFHSNTATQEQIDAYAQLNSIADEYNLTLEQLIAKLEQLGLISNNIKLDLRNKLIPSRSGLTAGFNSVMEDAFSKVDADVATKWVQSLSDEEVVLANSKEFGQALEKQKVLLDNGTLSAENYSKALEEVKTQQNAIGEPETENSITPTLSSSVEQIARQLEPQFAKLGEAYKEIFTADGFTLDDVDNSMLEDLRTTFAEIEEEVGVAFDASVLNPFFDTLTNKSSTVEQVQDAFNNLATAYFYSTETLEHLTSETADAIEKQLEEMGVQNAAEVVAEALTAKTEELIVAKEYLAQTGKELATATEEEQTAFILEQIEAGNCGEALALLQLKKLLVNSTQINTSADIQQIMNLASAAGMGAEVLTQLANAKSILGTVEARGTVSLNSYQKALDDIESAKQTMLDWKPVELDFSNVGGGASKAGGAGKDAGDAYVDAFEAELKNLQDFRDRGVIDEAEYLRRLRELYTRYFADRKDYLNEFRKYEREYLEGMKSLYESALSGISKLLSNQIDGYSEAKEAAVSSLTEEKEARLEVINAQKEQLEAEQDLIDEQIKEKQKIIDQIQDEIDAMKEAREERQRQLDLQKAQYELERMMHQRTILQYSEDKGMHYINDSSGARSAKEKVDDAKFEIEVAQKEKEIDLIQKEIDLLEEKKDAIQDQIDALDKQADSVEKYYSKMISEQEKYFDSLISNMEKQKSKWEELAEIKEITKAYSDIEQVFGDMGYTVQDILNDNEQAFEDFKSKYISLMNDMNSNSSFAEGLSYATGVAKENLGSFLDKTKETAEGLDELGEKGSEMDSVAEGMDKLSDSATTASTSTGEIASNMGELNTNTEGLSDNLNGIGNALTGIPEADKFDTLTTSFTNLGDAIKGVASALGVGEEGTVGGLVGALQSLSELSLGEEDTGILSQFNNLKTAVEGVTSAISGGGSSGGKGGDASGSSSASMSAGADGEGGSGSLVGAIEEFKSATDEALGGGDEEGEGSEGGRTGAIPQFKELKTAVDDVTTAIGSGDAEGGESSGEGESDNLIDSIVNLGETSTETLGESDGDGVIGKFNEFKGVIEEAANQVKSISEGLDEIDGKEVECSITVNVKMNGSIPAFASGTVLGNMQIESATYNAQYGKAFASGTIGLKHDEKNALRSEYGQPELTVYPNGTTELTTSPVMSDLPKGTVIYNEEETKKIMDNKSNPVDNAHADGTDDTIWTTLADGSKVRPLQPGDKMWDLYQKFDAYFKSIDGNLEKLVPNSFYEQNREWNKLADQITYANSVVNNRNVQPVVNNINVTCPGVTEQQVAERIGGVLDKELDKKFNGFSNYTYQRSRMR